MAKRFHNPHEEIRNIIDGRNVGRAKAKLAKMGEAAVRPLLEAMTGGHGRIGDSLNDLIDVLKTIARKDVKPLVKCLDDHPALNIVVHAIGHAALDRKKVDRAAMRVLKKFDDHEDDGISSVVDHHVDRIQRATGKKKRVAKKPSRKRKVGKTPAGGGSKPKRKPARKKAVRRPAKKK